MKSQHNLALIYYFSKNQLAKRLGFEVVDLSDLYFPVYTFQYVSSGGNSSLKCDIKLNIENLNKFVIYLNELVKFKQSIKGQRGINDFMVTRQNQEKRLFYL